MKAKASKTRGASFGGGGGAGTVNLKATAGEVEGSVPGSVAPMGFEAANRIVAAATRC